MAIDATPTHVEAAREHALVASARVDAAAFGELYDAYLPQIYGFIARRVDDRTVAEDLTAATFQRALGAVLAPISETHRSAASCIGSRRAPWSTTPAERGA